MASQQELGLDCHGFRYGRSSFWFATEGFVADSGSLHAGPEREIPEEEARPQDRARLEPEAQLRGGSGSLLKVMPCAFVLILVLM